MATSIKKNFAYNSVLTLSQYVFGLITLPYISRVLGVENIGIVGFVDNAINYFLLFSMLGIAIVGQREIAKFQNNPQKLNTTYSSLLSISLILSIAILAIYFLALLFVPEFIKNKQLFYIGAAKIIATVFLIEWFYKGIENFKYISICNIAIKIIYVVSIFLFVRNTDDYVTYFALTVGTVVLNAIINFLYSKKLVTFSFRNIELKAYIKPIIQLGAYTILTSMYTTFNILYLGFVSDSKEVGYYWTALKIYTIVIAFYTAFTNVMLPRMTNILSQGNTSTFRIEINKSFDFLFSISLPIIAFTTILAPQIIRLISGVGYEGAIIPMQIIMPLILVVGIAQILAIQILMPMQKDKVVFKASVIGAIIGVLLNILLVKPFGCIGTAMVLVMSEIIVTGFYFIVILKNDIIKFPFKQLIKRLILAIPYFAICLIGLLFDSYVLSLLVVAAISAFYWLFLEIKIYKTFNLTALINKNNI